MVTFCKRIGHSEIAFEIFNGFDSGIKRKADADVPRGFSDYQVTVDDVGLPPGVTLIKRV